MSTPKSVVRLNKKGIKYTSEVDKCDYYLFELSRAAMRDVGRFLAKEFRTSYGLSVNQRTGNGKKGVKYSAVSGKKTQYPRVEIGWKGSLGFQSSFQEFGNSKTKKQGLLKKAAMGNIRKILEIESQYLSAINVSDGTVQSKINESDMEGDADN